MAEKEVKDIKTAADAKKAPKKVKKDKPSVFKRIGAWFKSCKSEMKKIVWTGWSTVRSNTLMVLACIILISIVIGLVDVLFSKSVILLGQLI